MSSPSSSMTSRAGAGNTVAAMWKRDLLRILRNKGAMISSIIIPSLFLLSFYAAFSRTSEIFIDNYADFLMPAGVLQAIIFCAGGSCLPVAKDKEDGFYDRLLSMPLGAWTIVAGRMLADATRIIWSTAVTVIVALLLGARFHGGIGAIVMFILIIFLVTLIFSAAADGLVLLTKHPSTSALTLQGLTIAILMMSTAFVPANALHGTTRTIIEHLPLSPVLETMRALAAGTSPGSDGIEAACWLIGLTVIGFWGFTAALRRSNV